MADADDANGTAGEDQGDDTSGGRTDEAVSGSTRPRPWRQLDYSSADEGARFESTATDRDVPQAGTDHERGQTGFNVRDAPAHERKWWRHLRRLNDGVRGDSRGAQKHHGGIERDLGVVAGQLELSEYQHGRAEYVLETLDLQDDVSRRASVEAIVLAVVTMVVNEDGRWLQREDKYEQVRDELGVDSDEVRWLRDHLRDTDQF